MKCDVGGCDREAKAGYGVAFQNRCERHPGITLGFAPVEYLSKEEIVTRYGTFPDADSDDPKNGGSKPEADQ